MQGQCAQLRRGPNPLYLDSLGNAMPSKASSANLDSCKDAWMRQTETRRAVWMPQIEPSSGYQGNTPCLAVADFSELSLPVANHRWRDRRFPDRRILAGGWLLLHQCDRRQIICTVASNARACRAF